MKHLPTLLIATFFATMLYTSCESSLFGGDDNEEIKLDFKCQIAGESPNALLYIWNYSSGADEYVWSFSNGASVTSRTGYTPDTTIYVRSKGELIVTLTATRGSETVSDSDTLMVEGYSLYILRITYFGIDGTDVGRYFSIDHNQIFTEEQINESNGHLIDFAFVQDGDLCTFKSPDDPSLGFNIPNAKNVKIMYHEGFCKDLGIGEMKDTDTIKYINIIPNAFWVPINLFDPPSYAVFELPDGRRGFMQIDGNAYIEDSFKTYFYCQDLFDIEGK